MNKSPYTKHFLLFFSLVVGLVYVSNSILAGVLDMLYKKMLTGQSGGEVNAYLTLPKQPTLLIMGNSRARYQINPDSFDLPTYSLCHAGMGQVFQTELLEVLIQEHKLPSRILLHVDLAEYANEDNLEDVGNLRYYYGKIPSITEEINNISRYERLKYLFSLYRYNGRIISTLKNYIQTRQSKIKSGNGYSAIAPIPIDTLALTTPVATSVLPRFHYANLRHLERFIILCQKHHVQLLCFTSPYFIAQPFTKVVASPLDSLLRKQQVPYLNTSTHPLPVLIHHARFWQDNDHLNQLGARYLSQEIAHWVSNQEL